MYLVRPQRQRLESEQDGSGNGRCSQGQAFNPNSYVRNRVVGVKPIRTRNVEAASCRFASRRTCGSQLRWKRQDVSSTLSPCLKCGFRFNIRGRVGALNRMVQAHTGRTCLSNSVALVTVKIPQAAMFCMRFSVTFKTDFTNAKKKTQKKRLAFPIHLCYILFNSLILPILRYADEREGNGPMTVRATSRKAGATAISDCREPCLGTLEKCFPASS